MKNLIILSILVISLSLSPASGNDTNCRLVSPQITWELADLASFNPEWIQVKFVEGSNVILNQNQFTDDTGLDLAIVNDLLSNSSIIQTRRTFSLDRSTLRAWKAEGEKRAGTIGPDLSLWYNIRINGGHGEIARLVNDLNRSPAVEIAHPMPIVEPAAIAGNDIDPSNPHGRRDFLTPDFSAQQEYLYDTPIGLDAPSAWALTGGLGENMQFIDVELCWTEDHEDFEFDNCFYIGGTAQDPDYETHGTAVLGEVIGQHNGLGVKGFAPAVDYGVVAIDINAYPDVADYFLEAVNNLEAGDVWLIELQMYPGSHSATPMEWLQVNYDVIWTSVWARQIVCVEAGANGSQDLDDPAWGGIFDRDLRDSGAIMVGAGTPTSRLAEGFSNYGSRMDVHAWGSQIVTTGYGDLYNGGSLQSCYTSAFGGTSGASPMIVGSCLCLQGIAKSAIGSPLDPIMLRSILHDTGIDHLDPSREIGPRPDLSAAANMVISLGTTPFLTLESLAIDDDDIGGSEGNNNGNADFNETIELTVTLGNLGQVDGTDVAGELLTDDQYVTVQIPNGSFGTVPSGGTGENLSPFVFIIHPDAPDQHLARFDLALTEFPDTLEISVILNAPVISLSTYQLDDTIGGNGNGIAEPGEEIALELTLANQGGAPVENLSAVLSGDAYLDVDSTPISFSTIDPGLDATGGPVQITILPECPNPYAAPLSMNLSGSGSFTDTIDFSIFIGLFADDMENGDAAWTHYPGVTGYGDQWHIETFRNHTTDGSTSWKCGHPGGSDHDNGLCSVLESTQFLLPPNATLSFWHWLEAELSSAHTGYCYDGGLVEISIDGGAWEVITPDGGYPYSILNGIGLIPAETAVYSGSFSWTEANFDLTGYEGNARIRFIFASDGAVTNEGWYLDDRVISADFTATPEDQSVRTLRLHAALPNPMTNITQVQFDLPRAESAEINIYDAAGRRIRTLHSGPLGAGRHTLSWHGLDESRFPAPAGIYWLKAQVANQPTQSTRVVIIR